MKKERIDSINLIRAIAAVAVFLYHGYWNIGCRYGVLDVWIEQAYVWMTLFFVLSGLVLRYNYGDNKFDSPGALGKYFGKRALSIFPLYFLIYFVYLFLGSNATIFTDVTTFPYQALLLQEFAHYPYLMNGGTWFFSCIFICYLLFPYLNMIASAMTLRQTAVGSAVLLILLGFTPFVGMTYGLNVYNNAFVRILEFALGVCLVKIIEESPKVSEKINSSKPAKMLWIPVFIIFLAGIFVLQKIKAVDDYPTYLNLYSGMACMALLYTIVVCKDKVLIAISSSKVIKFLSDYSLEIWCATFFTATLAPFYQRLIGGAHFNLLNCIISAVINVIIAVLLKLYGKLVKKLLEKNAAKRLILTVVIIFTAYIGFRVVSTMNVYDYSKTDIRTDKITGAYHDEGDYAWISKECSVEFTGKYASQITIKADTSVADIGSDVICGVYINETHVEDIILTGETKEFVINIPKGVITDSKYQVRLLCDKSFVPSQTNPASTDARELAARLFSISCK